MMVRLLLSTEGRPQSPLHTWSSMFSTQNGNWRKRAAVFRKSEVLACAPPLRSISGAKPAQPRAPSMLRLIFICVSRHVRFNFWQLQMVPCTGLTRHVYLAPSRGVETCLLPSSWHIPPPSTASVKLYSELRTQCTPCSLEPTKLPWVSVN